MRPLHMLCPPLTAEEQRELCDRLRFRCEHGHNGISHRRCFDRAERKEERIGFFDIETHGFNADFGIMLSYCIKVENEDVILQGLITSRDVRRVEEEDKRLVRQCVNDMKKFDRLVVYWGKHRRHDIPFVRTRAMSMGVPFLVHREIYVTDVWDWVKNNLRLERNSQERACLAILGETDKTRFNGRIWHRAAKGDKECLATILDHNQRDVRDLEKLYHTLLPYVRNTNASI
uniref:Putative RNase_H superfamily protein n=1 Tax=viral metagenome TaxID=1070528 RepID=A0A6M3JWR4_9ZZZZ